MRKVINIFIVLLLSVCAANAQRPWDNGKLQVSANSRFLQFSNGKPFFWLGDTGWLLPENLNRQEANYYLSKCKKAGYNVVQVQTVNGIPAFNVYGQMSFEDNTWNTATASHKGVYGYWEHMDYIIKTAEANGIYIAMVPVWGGMVGHGAINEKQAADYGTFLGKRYKDSPNIIWMIGGDIQGNIHPEVWNSLAHAIKAVDKNHIMTYHPRGRYTSAKWWSKADWLDFHMFQSGHRKYGQRMGNKDYPIPDDTEEDNWMYVDSTWAYKPIKPVLDGEPSYEGIPKGLHDPNEGRWQDYDVRRYAYWSVFAGSCGHTYGHNSIMQMLKPGYGTSYGNSGKELYWYEALECPGFNQMHILKDLMLAFPYFERVPDQSIIVGKNGTKYNRLIATRGNDYLLVYNYNSVPMKLDLTKISGSKKNCWWLNTATGDLTFIGTFDNKTATFFQQNPHPGVPDDGVFIAIDSSKNYITKDQKQLINTALGAAKRNLNE